MTRLLLATILAVTVGFAYHGIAFAACGEGPPDTFTCDTTPPNPDPMGVQQPGNFNDLTVNVLPGAGVDTTLANGGNGGPGLRTAIGEDKVNVDNGDVAGELDGINTSSGPDEVTVKDSTVVSATTDGINTSASPDIVTVINSTITGALDGIDTSSDKDIVTVTDSTVTGQIGTGIDTSSDMDQVTVTNSIVSGGTAAIRTSSNTDTITFGTGADIRGIIDCGSDFDTIIFTMDVPEEAVGVITSQILQAGVPDGSITINGLFYEWINCELLVPQLNGVRVVRPIPTLSEWGLIALAGVLGLIGLIAIHRKKAVA